MEPDISLRPEQPEDQALVHLIYASTRAAELEIVPWSDARKEEFINMQFRLQTAHFRRNHPHASYDIILKDGTPVGRFYIAREADEARVLDIALLPDYRGQGIGTMLLRRLMAEAEEGRIPLRLHVERHNRARRLYERLGFRVIADGGVYLEMEYFARTQ